MWSHMYKKHLSYNVKKQSLSWNKTQKILAIYLSEISANKCAVIFLANNH